MIQANAAATASNVIYSAFIAIICSNFYVSTQGEPFGFYNPALLLPGLNKAFLICVISYLVLNWLTDTVYHANPSFISDLYLVGTLVRISLFGFCFFEAFNPDGFKFYLFAFAGLLEIFLEYFAFKTCIQPGIKEAEKKAEEKSGDAVIAKITKFGFAAATAVPLLFFLLRLLSLVGVFFFSYGLPSDINNSGQNAQAIAVVSCIIAFTFLKVIAWLILRENNFIHLFESEEGAA